MKYILVTGAYGGMGRKTAELMKKQGFGVFAFDKSPGISEDNIIPITADITDEGSVKCAFEKVKEVTDELYAIVHFAGIYMPLLKSGSRIVITTSELAPLDPLPFTGIYAVTKSALDKYAYSLRMEVQLKGIYVSVIRAGAVDTGMLGASTSALDAFCEKSKLYT